MNIGIVVAVSKYAGTPTNLRACETDGAAMHALLTATGRFNEVVLLSTEEETTSFNVKKVLSELADRNRGALVDEVCFYFSGHGDFDGSEFRFILSDYDARKKNQTTLNNTELDGIFRSLSPALYVKIVDACNSGVAYIKGDDELRDYLKGPAQSSFKNLYFMFSSQSDEASFANHHISFFTRSILEVVKSPTPRTVRYRDVMSAASDEFATRGGQTPLFITQANNTEIFCETSIEISESLHGYLAGPVSAVKSGKHMSLSDRIAQSGVEYCSQEEANGALDHLLSLWENFDLNGELNGLYEVDISTGENVISGSQGIASWLDEAKDKTFFAKVIKRDESYATREPKNPYAFPTISTARLLGGGVDDDEYKIVRRVRSVIDKYELTTDQRYAFIVITLSPKSAALTPVKCFVAPIISRKTLVIFWRLQHYDYKDWQNTFATKTTKWARAEGRIKDFDRISAIFTEIADEFRTFVLEPLLEQWPAESEVSEEASKFEQKTD